MVFSRHFFGQQHLSGLQAALGVFVVAALANAAFGFTAAVVAGAGAMCVSIVDQPAPMTQKLGMLGLALCFIGITTFITGLSQSNEILLLAVVVIDSFLAALLSAYGRAALPLGISVSLSLVLAMGTPLDGMAEVRQHTLTFIGGAAIYIVWSMIAARVLESRNKSLAMADCLRALAQCLRNQARFYDAGTDLDLIYRMLIDRQAVLTERLQLARNLIYDHVYESEDRRRVQEFFVIFDIFESALSSQTDYRLLREHFAAEESFTALGAVVTGLAEDLERLAQTAYETGGTFTPTDFRAALETIDRAVTRLETAAEVKNPVALMALRTNFNKIRYSINEGTRLFDMVATPNNAFEDGVPLDLARFVQRPNFRIAILTYQINLSSPTFRYALRVALAMGCGYLLAQYLPYASHGNWILLTIALVMRANYSITKQRRNDRLIGNVIGCIAGAVILHVFPQPLVLASIFIAIGVSHTYGPRNYRIAATSACIMALLQIHILAPSGGALLVERVLDTAIGTGLAYIFSHVFPHWEVESLPKLMIDMLKADLDYVRQALKVEPDALTYRLTRKRMLDTMALLSGALSRMLEEPSSVRHRRAEELGSLLTANHLLASHLASVQMFFRNRAGQLPPDMLEQLTAGCRGETEAILTRALASFAGSKSSDVKIPTASSQRLTGGDPKSVFCRRLELVADEAKTISGLAATLSPDAVKAAQPPPLCKPCKSGQAWSKYNRIYKREACHVGSIACDDRCGRPAGTGIGKRPDIRKGPSRFGFGLFQG
jgi:uncharacterized membrane protein YccC